MNVHQESRRHSRVAPTVTLALAALWFCGPAEAGCGFYPPDAAALSAAAGLRAAAAPRHAAGVSAPASDALRTLGIVGMWQFQFVSDGTAYPAPIPAGVVVDFGTTQWHADGTEMMISGGRPPSTADVCMGAWRMTGLGRYHLEHLALSWVSADTPPPVGPVAPAMYQGPAVIREDVRLVPPFTAFSGTFTIDQYAADGTTLLEHVGGTVTANRFMP